MRLRGIERNMYFYQHVALVIPDVNIKKIGIKHGKIIRIIFFNYLIFIIYIRFSSERILVVLESE